MISSARLGRRRRRREFCAVARGLNFPQLQLLLLLLLLLILLRLRMAVANLKRHELKERRRRDEDKGCLAHAMNDNNFFSSPHSGLLLPLPLPLLPSGALRQADNKMAPPASGSTCAVAAAARCGHQC